MLRCVGERTVCVRVCVFVCVCMCVCVCVCVCVCMHAVIVCIGMHQLFPDPDTSVISCWWSKTSPSGPLKSSFTTPSSISTRTA